MSKRSKSGKLVAEAFLEKVIDKDKIYHIDGNNSNSKYNNLMYVSIYEERALRTGKKTVKDLN